MVTIIDYNAGNVTSVRRAFEHLGIPCAVSGDPAAVANAQRLVFPGVGHAGAAMAELNETGLADAIRSAHAKGTPILGICVGCQILMDHSDEGDTPCLGLLGGNVARFELGPQFKVPHMGWNEIRALREHPLLEDVGREFYFVHSYYVQPSDAGDVIAVCGHGIEFPAVVGRGSLVAAQFHPEKSGEGGLRLLRNFSEWEGGAHA